MFPAVAFADEGEVFTIGPPLDPVANLGPCIVLVFEDRAEFGRRGVDRVNGVRVLQTIESLQQELIAVRHPVDSGGVVFARVARQVDEFGLAACHVVDANRDRRVRRADFWILEFD